MKTLILALAAAASLAAVSSALPASAEVRYAPHVFATRFDHERHYHHHWAYDRHHHRHWR
jgi:Spy/CpxP family protein refolding chaperone